MKWACKCVCGAAKFSIPTLPAATHVGHVAAKMEMLNAVSKTVDPFLSWPDERNMFCVFHSAPFSSFCYSSWHVSAGPYILGSHQRIIEEGGGGKLREAETAH